MKRLVFTRFFQRISLFVPAFFLLSPFIPFDFAYAQVPTAIDGIQITLTPQNPTPGGNVDVNLQDYLTNLSSAYITWVVNGNKVTEGVGKIDVNITAPPLGQQKNLTILIQTQEGKSIQKTLVVKSGAVDLVFESQGYAPPLYQGKQDFAYQNTVKIVAMPHLADSSGKQLDPATLVYNWKQDSKALQDQSGYGKRSITVTGAIIPRPTTITVDVSTRNGSETASGEIILRPTSPSIVLYKDDPLYGVLYNMALGAQTSFLNQEITLLAAPFSFSIPSLLNNNLQYGWVVNAQSQANLVKNRSITLRVEDASTDASYPVQLTLQNSQEILQSAATAITAAFKANKNNNAPQL